MSQSPFGDIGPVEVVFGSTTLTENGSVKHSFSMDTAEHKTARYGSKPKSKIVTGNGVEVTVNLKEPSLAQLEKAIPGATLTDGVLTVRNNVGTDLRDIAEPLILKRIIDGVASTDPANWITVFIAAPEPSGELVFDESTDRSIDLKFVGMPVETANSPQGTNVGDLWAVGFGDPTAAVIVPTGLAATAGVNEIDLSWNATGQATLAGYNIYRSTSALGPFGKVNSAVVVGTTFTEPVTDGILYHYKVQAQLTGGDVSQQSASDSATATAS